MADLQALGAKIKEEDDMRYKERKAFEEQAASREEELKAQARVHS